MSALHAKLEFNNPRVQVPMFTGIIQSVGKLVSSESVSTDSGNGERSKDRQMTFDLGTLNPADIAIGDSVATSGVCLTAVTIRDNQMVVDVSAETLAFTTLGDLVAGEAVNLELALRADSRLGGHMVSGHVDGVGEVVSRTSEARSERLEFSVPTELARYIAAKGSVCIEGVSLTVNEVNGSRFSVNLIPHTLSETNLDRCQPGTRVNIEIDVVARYLERLLTGSPDQPDSITMAGENRDTRIG